MTKQTYIPTRLKYLGVIAFVILLFTLVNMFRLFPFQDTLWESQVKVQDNNFDDWDWYAQYALNIKRNGIFSPNPISAPTSFLYGYFLAFCFFLFGENTIPVYIIQSILLSISIVLIYYAFCDKLKRNKLLLLGALIVFGLVDINRHNTFRCLSEILTIFLLAAFLFFFIKGIEKNRFHYQLISSVLLAMSCLTRPNIWIFAIIAIIIYAYYVKRYRNILLYIFVFFLIVSFQPLTNYFVNGCFVFYPTEKINGYFSTALSFNYTYRNLLSSFGFMSFTDPAFLWRPHWTLMWLAYFISIIYKIKEKQKFKLWEVISHSLIASYYLVVILVVNPDNGNYGFRFYLPALLVVLTISFVTTTNQIIDKNQS
jgi:hypothetical protein